MSFDYVSYRLGKRSLDRVVVRLRKVLGDDEAAELVGILAGARDCGSVEERLRPWFAWKSLAWAYSPQGPPPSVKFQLVLEAICKEGIPLDEEFLRELAPPEHSGGEEWEVEGEVV